MFATLEHLLQVCIDDTQSGVLYHLIKKLTKNFIDLFVNKLAIIDHNM